MLLLFEFELRLLSSAAGRAPALSGNLCPRGVFCRMAMFSGRALVTLARALTRVLECGGFASLGHGSLRVSLFRASQYSAAAFFFSFASFSGVLGLVRKSALRFSLRFRSSVSSAM